MAITSQTVAETAFGRVRAHQPITDEYRSFAREFPTLVHQCGLAQAVAFALAKGGQQEEYARDLAAVLKVGSVDDLADRTRQSGTANYIRLSRDALKAAVWLKRYVEALHGAASQSSDGQPGGKT
jgi:CRISPR-associated protein Cmr5